MAPSLTTSLADQSKKERKVGALLLYGNGGGLGNFRLFADDLISTTLSKKYRLYLETVHTTRRSHFFNAILSTKFDIAELHIFTHSIGGGLFLSYGDREIDAARAAAIQIAINNKRDVTYDEVVSAEKGAVLTDHLIAESLIKQRAAIQKKFTKDAFIKIWGCNSGVRDWVYADNDEIVYWSALNNKNFPKPSVAQSIANFFKKPVYGAESGANIQVLHKGHWIYADEYKKTTGRYAGEPEILRLQPVRGGYKLYKPTSN